MYHILEISILFILRKTLGSSLTEKSFLRLQTVINQLKAIINLKSLS